MGPRALLLLLLITSLGAALAAPATTAKPPSARSTPAPAGCNCRCSLHHYDPVCARSSKGERTTFSNMCQLSCYNCTHDADFRIVLRKACS